MAGRVAYYGGIVKDGLVLDLDAAKRDSYPGSGTSWRDIAGGVITGSLINGPTFDGNNGGSIVFDGADDYASIGTNENYNFGTNDFTIECWLYFNSLSTSQIFISKYLTWTSNLDFVGRLLSASGKLVFYGGDSIQINLATISGISQSTWYHYCVSRISNVTSMYLNSILQQTQSGTVLIPNDKTELRLGRSHDNDEPFNGRISNFRIYKGKGLSAAEVTQNYNALKGRYGL
jgi:hypothetical protein